MSPFLQRVWEVVHLNSDSKEGKDVYEPVFNNHNGPFALHATTLLRLGSTAGLIWNAKNCHRTDDGKNDDLVIWMAEAMLKKDDGTFSILNASYALDFKVIRQELTDQYVRKYTLLMNEDKKKYPESGREAFVKKNVERDYLYKRNHRFTLAETGARSRVIRQILGLKSSYIKVRNVALNRTLFAPGRSV